MPEHATVECTRCHTTAEVPPDGNHAPLWDAGWRWMGSQKLYSCPTCPPVITVAPDGRHRREPGEAGNSGTEAGRGSR